MGAMVNPWQAEHELDAERAAALIGAQFSELRGAEVTAYGVGWDNTAFLVDGRWVFRFPRRALAVRLIENETRCLGPVAERVPLPIPAPRFVGVPADGYPWPFAGYRLLPGTTACRANLDGDARRRLATPLAHFLRALHGISAEQALAWGAPHDEMRRLELPYRLDMARERLAAAFEAGLITPSVRTGLDTALGRMPPNWKAAEVCMCHGDLYSRHLLVDDAGAACGIIDWGDLHAGDPAVDLALVHALLPVDAHAGFRRAYGPIEPASWQVGRLKAIVTNLVVVIYATDVGDIDLEREGRWALTNMAQAGSC